MNDNLKVVVVTVVVLLCTFGVATVVRNDQSRIERSCPATVKTLEADPDLYRGVLVKIPTDGFQPGQKPNELVFHRRADFPPVVVATFSDPLPAHLPKFLVGRCVGSIGNHIAINECRFVKD